MLTERIRDLEGHFAAFQDRKFGNGFAKNISQDAHNSINTMAKEFSVLSPIVYSAQFLIKDSF